MVTVPLDRSPLCRRALLRTAVAGSLLLVPALRSRAVPAAAAAHADDDPPDDDTIPLLIPDDVGEQEVWVDVNLTEQAAVAMVGREWTHVALVTSGRPGWETPEGQFRIVRRVANETMTSAALGISDPDDQYVLRDVLYTQYFTWEGHALHLNYWRPDRVFGRERTSHGCVGMRLADAEFFWRHLSAGSRVVVHA